MARKEIKARAHLCLLLNNYKLTTVSHFSHSSKLHFDGLLCRAVRRAEFHAEASGKDPRHIGVPRDIGDDILKKVSMSHHTQQALCSV